MFLAIPCYHLLCEVCYLKKSPLCTHCGEQCQLMKINNEMERSGRWYFGSPSIVHDHLFNVMEFQRNQEKLIIEGKSIHAVKLNDKLKQMKIIEKELDREVTKYRKMKIIFKKLCEEKRFVLMNVFTVLLLFEQFYLESEFICIFDCICDSFVNYS